MSEDEKKMIDDKLQSNNQELKEDMFIGFGENGEEKTFTTKEFDLLTFLAENPNRVFTKAELFRQIWDMESVGDIATVTVHIKKIREKIEFNTAKPQYIETIWGVGYRFKV